MAVKLYRDMDPDEQRLHDLVFRIKEVYRQARTELQDKYIDFLHDHEARVEMYKKQVDAGLLSKSDFDAWMRGQIFQQRQWELRRGQLARAMVDLDKRVLELINERKIEVFADNAEFMLFQIGRDLGALASFGEYDRKTFERLILDDPKLLPRLDEEKDYERYNRIINNCVTQSIIQGETLDQLAKRIGEETEEQAIITMKRNARTAFTCAQAAGRQAGMLYARDTMGIDVKKRWSCIFDDKTRDAHQQLDGKTAEVDEPFESIMGPIMYPGDPDAAPANVYNCRCKLSRAYGKYDVKINRVDAMNGERTEARDYREWLKLKAKEAGGNA